MIAELEPDFPEGSVGHWIKQQSEDWQEIIVQRMKDCGRIDHLGDVEHNPLLVALDITDLTEPAHFWFSIAWLLNKTGLTRIPFSYDEICKSYRIGKYAKPPKSMSNESLLDIAKDGTLIAIESIMQRWHLGRSNDGEALESISELLKSVGLLSFFDKEKAIKPKKTDVSGSVCPDCLNGRDEFEPDWLCPICRKQTDH